MTGITQKSSVALFPLGSLKKMILIYKSCHLESIFIEIILTKKTNIITGCIYRHPSMNICTFNDHYLNPLLKKLSKENDKKNVL